MQLLPRLVTSKSSRTTTRFLSLFEATVCSHLAANRVEQRLDFFLCSRRQFFPILPQIESNSDSIYYVCAFFRDSKAIAFSYDRFAIQIFIRQNHFQRHILPKTSNHRAQAVTTTAQRPGSWEQSNLPAPKKKLSRFPTQFRRDQTRQQSSTGTARRRARINTGRKPSPPRRSDRKVGNKAPVRTIKKSGRCPTRFRRDQTRQQSSAGTARPEKGG